MVEELHEERMALLAQIHKTMHQGSLQVSANAQQYEDVSS